MQMGMEPSCYFTPNGRELYAFWQIGSCPFVWKTFKSINQSSWGFHSVITALM